jgi:hypothetical protein
MIRNYYQFIKEAKGNVYQIGTPFSNGHRSRKNGDGFLLDRHLMIDIDKIIIDPSENIVGLIERKAQLPKKGSQFSNILDPSVKSPQKIALLELSNKLGCKLFIHVQSDKEYHLLKSDFSVKTYTESLMDETLLKMNYRIIDTDNLIFLEFRMNYGSVSLKAVVERFGKSDAILTRYLNQISEKCGGIPIIKVNDERPQMTFVQNGQLVGTVPSILDPKSVSGEERLKIELMWEDIYKKMGIFN